MSARYAVYFAPLQGSTWWNFGAHWLGRDESQNLPIQPPALADIAESHLERMTQVPRRYGFHATLKAPFYLAPGIDEAVLTSRVAMLASSLQPLLLGRLALATLGNFVALVPAADMTDSDGLQALAAACVTGLDDLRAPLGAADLARRDSTVLDERGRELLTRFGYPYVLERFRLHFTLTGPIEQAEAALVARAVTHRVEHLNTQTPLILDRLCLFLEADAGAPFVRIADFTLGARP